MKTLIPVFIILLLAGCGKTPEEKLVGSYEDGQYKFVLLENATVEIFENGKKVDSGPWKIDGKEVRFGDGNSIDVFKIEANGNLIRVADITKGKRKDLEKEHQTTLKKIK
jgi:hypothetical protein